MRQGRNLQTWWRWRTAHAKLLYFSRLHYFYVNFSIAFFKTNQPMYHASEKSQQGTGDKLWGVSCEVKPNHPFRNCDLTKQESIGYRSVLPGVLFFLQICLFFDLVGEWNLHLAGGGFFGYFFNISVEKLADFCTKLKPVFVQKHVKIHLMQYTTTKLIFVCCARSFAQCWRS